MNRAEVHIQSFLASHSCTLEPKAAVRSERKIKSKVAGF